MHLNMPFFTFQAFVSLRFLGSWHFSIKLWLNLPGYLVFCYEYLFHHVRESWALTLFLGFERVVISAQSFFALLQSSAEPSPKEPLHPCSYQSIWCPSLAD
jgi:hypothetical protein